MREHLVFAVQLVCRGLALLGALDLFRRAVPALRGELVVARFVYGTMRVPLYGRAAVAWGLVVTCAAVVLLGIAVLGFW